MSASRVAFVTGANKGIGFELVRQLVEKYSYGVVFAACRNPDQASYLQTLSKKYAGVKIVQLDVSDEKSIKTAASSVFNSTKKIDLLINNAAILDPIKRIEEVTAESLIKSFTTNTVGPIITTQALLPLLRAGEGKIIANITSRVGSIADNGSGGAWPYRISKTALNMANKNESLQLGPEGFTCVALHPGMIATDMVKQLHGTPQNHRTPEDGAAKLLDIIANLKKEDNGKFISWDKSEIPW